MGQIDGSPKIQEAVYEVFIEGDSVGSVRMSEKSQLKEVTDPEGGGDALSSAAAPGGVESRQTSIAYEYKIEVKLNRSDKKVQKSLEKCFEDNIGKVSKIDMQAVSKQCLKLGIVLKRISEQFNLTK